MWLAVCLGVSGIASVGRAQAPASRMVDPRPDVRAGQVVTYLLQDSTYHRPRRVWVYTPPGYDARAAQPYPLLIAFDGWVYLDSMPLPMILDTLLAARHAPAFVAFLIDDSSSATRIADLGNAHRMIDLLSGQLLPWVRRGWRVTSDPHRVIVTGSSAGGLASACLGFSRPDLVANVWSQSGALWRGAEASNDPPYEWLTAQVSASPRRDVRFVLDVGALEVHGAMGGAAPSILDANRHLRDALRARGYEVSYVEVPDGNHAERWWRLRLPAGIVELSRGWAGR
jgi:enterochelin esterase family protein